MQSQVKGLCEGVNGRRSRHVVSERVSADSNLINRQAVTSEWSALVPKVRMSPTNLCRRFPLALDYIQPNRES